jgi:Zn finger protein HypA/HybF involved in hydrogenase expression
MNGSEPLDALGFQKITCKNPQCQNLFKTVYFLEGWTKKTIINNGSILVQDNGGSYYKCSKCGSKNYVTFQGEKIILEKIIRL